MVDGKMKDKLLSESIGREILLYYNDTYSSVSFKEGTFLDFDENNYKIEDRKTHETIIIPRQKCIRMQIMGNVSYAKA